MVWPAWIWNYELVELRYFLKVWVSSFSLQVTSLGNSGHICSWQYELRLSSGTSLNGTRVFHLLLSVPVHGLYLPAPKTLESGICNTDIRGRVRAI